MVEPLSHLLVRSSAAAPAAMLTIMPRRPSRSTRKPSDPPTVPDYAAWKKQAAAELEKIEPGATVLSERIWRDLYIRNLSPAHAGRQAAVYAHNAGHRPGTSRRR